MRNEYNLTSVEMNPVNATELLNGMQQLCDGLQDSIFTWSAAGILRRKPAYSEQENAYSFVTESYDILGGAIRMMAAATDIINTAINNGDLELVPGKRAYK